MTGKLNRHAYEYLIRGNIEWLEKNTDDCLERQHIIDVLQGSADKEYGTPDPDTEAANVEQTDSMGRLP